ncbi:MAG: Na+:solute symporter [Planctomycetes bacterium]|nr:Na+:solute symporter [Planctomycetota bacterium]
MISMQVLAEAHVQALSLIDWVIVAVFLLGSMCVGLIFTKKASQNISSFFVSGRSLPWYVCAMAWVASGFASDTPLWVSARVRENGIQDVWVYWAPLIGFGLGAVLFARLWRRLGVITDVEVLENRYSGKLAPILRFWEGGSKAIFFCPLIIGWVVKAMEVIAREAMGLPEEYRVVTTAIVVGLGLVMCMAAGLWGVVATGTIQFILATIGTILLAIMSVRYVGGLDAMVEQLSAMKDWPGHTLDIAPSIGSGATQMSVWNAIGIFFIFWWGAAYCGDYAAQRILACKDSKNSSYCVLFTSILYFPIMAWPWVIVALCSMIVFPDLADHDSAYPKMMVTVLGPGLRGVLVAALIAAFISTVTTLFNWGGSYVVNDLYKRFIVRDATTKHYVNVSRIATLFMAILGGVISCMADSIGQLLQICWVIIPGVIVVGMMRWLWWRLNTAGDLAGTVTAWVFGFALLLFKVFDVPARKILNLDPEIEFSTDGDLLGARMIFLTAIVIIVSVTVSLLGKPNDIEHLKKFVKKSRPPKFLWRPVIDQMDIEYHSPETFWRTMLSWALAVISVGSLVFAIGKLLLGEPMLGLGCLAIFVISTLWVVMRIKEDFKHEQEEMQHDVDADIVV